MFILVVFAFLAGIVTILSPCILPVLPIVLSSTIGGKKTGISRPVGVVLGFIASFTFFTLFLSTIVKISGVSSSVLRTISVFVIAGFGISLLVPKFQIIIEKIFSRLSGFLPRSNIQSGFAPGLLIGFSLGLLWTPCVGPILASVISLAITGTVTFDAFVITIAYSLGTAIPMFLIMIGGQNMLQKVPWLLSNTARIQKAFGILMIITAIGIYYNVDRKFQTYLLDIFPQYGVGLTKFEDNPLIKNNLKQVGQKKVSGPVAPEIIPGGIWFNSKPLTIAELKGKVVIIDFWTYTCINCQRTLPYLKEWWKNYKDKGLVIIGVHSPEFEFEKDKNNLSKAITDFGLTYPIVQDNDFATWRAYENNYWPAKYIIDKDGVIRYTHFGEGAYNEAEKVIQDLLKEAGEKDISSEINNPTYQVQTKTPEIYLGFSRIDNFASPEPIKKNVLATYTSPANLGSNQISYEGNWNVMEEYANPQKSAKLVLNFESKEVFLVMRAKGNLSKIKVYIDDKLQYFGEDNKNGTVTIDSDRLYKLINLPGSSRHNLRIEFEDNNAELFAFTFG